jgi:ankyrin repeat protein
MIKGAEIDPKTIYLFENLIHQDIQNDHLELLNLLIKNGAEVKQDYENSDSPFYMASSRGHLGVVKFLIRKKAIINKAIINKANK